MLKVYDSVKERFYEYFSDGCSPAVAKRHYESLILIKEDFVVELANSAKNPTIRQIHYLFDKWREENIGPAINPFEKLREKCEFYEKAGTKVVIDLEGTWAVLVVTPIMKRVHSLQSTSEIIFIDSTASCESSNSSLIIVLGISKAGALPVAALIHENQSSESYQKSFALLKSNFPACFGGKEAPDIFMTDDSAAEKKALKEIWPSSIQLLCHFHVAQAEWRWLHSSQKVPLVKRSIFMKLFQAVMYATTEEMLATAFKNLLLSSKDAPEYQKRCIKFFKRRHEWTSCDRQIYFVRGHNTNNYAEATVRILKDVVLCRTKAFNVVALADFLVTVWEKYLTVKLLDFSNSRRSGPRLLYSSLIKNNSIPPEKIAFNKNGCFEIESKSGQKYEIDVEVGVCTCRRGITGAFCKHQAFLSQQLNLTLPNMPVLNIQDRHLLAFIALGEKCPPIHFFSEFTEMNRLTSTIPESDSSVVEVNSGSSFNATENFASYEEKEDLLNEFKRMLEVPIPKSTVNRLSSNFKGQRDEKI